MWMSPHGTDEPRDDGVLLEEFTRHGNQEAFRAIVRRHYALVAGVGRRVLGSREDAEDVAQAVFLILAHKAHALAGDRSLAAWLHQVAWREAMCARRAVVRRRKNEREARGMEELTEAERERWSDLRPVLDRELASLPEKFRLPILLHYLEGRTQQETARTIGCKFSTVTMRLMRAKELLRGRLARSGVAISTGTLFALIVREAAAAPVAEAVAASTAKAAALVSGGDGAAWGLVSPQVQLIAKGGLKAMAMTKIKAALAMTTLSVMMVGTGVAGYQALAENSSQDKPALTRPLANDKAKIGEIPAADFDKLFKQLLPEPATQTWQRVPWLAGAGSIVEARERAAKEGKPVFLLHTAGPVLGTS